MKAPAITRRGALLTLLCSSSLTVMAGATIAPGLGLMSGHFGGDPTLVKLVLTLPGLFTALAAPLAGWLADRHGRRKVLLPGLVLYALAGSQGLWAGSLSSLLVGRAMLGFAVGLIMTSATTLVLEYWDGEERRRVLGWQNAFMSFGGVAFQLMGGFLAEAMGWRGPFWVYLLPLPLAFAAVLLLPEPVRHVDRAKALDAPTRKRLRGFLMLMGAMAFVHMVVFYYTPVQTPFLLGELGVHSPGAIAGAISGATLFAGLASLQYARLRRRLAVGPLFALSFGLVGLGYALVWTTLGYWPILAGLAVASVGFGLARPNFTAWLNAHVPDAARARAVAVMSSSIFLGQFCTPFLAAPLVNGVGLPGAFLASGLLLAVAGLGLWWMERS